jgi:cytosine deaminase
MEKATIFGGFFKVLSLWGHAEQRSHQNIQAECSKEMPNDQSANAPLQGPTSSPARAVANLSVAEAEIVSAVSQVQEPFEYNDEQLGILEKAFSTDRLAPYYVQARGDRWVAIRLYERNTKLSEALYGVAQVLEVLLRNKIHCQLEKDIGAADWYDHVAFLGPERDEVEKAKRSIADRGAYATPGRVIAELSFGFWLRLFSGQYEKEFWVKHLHKLYAANRQRKAVHDRLMQIKTLRNRIAHHETLICRNPQRDYRDLLEAIGWLSPTVLAWVETTNCFEIRFAERIPKRVKERAPTASSVANSESQSSSKRELHEQMLAVALEEARLGFDEGGIPIGAALFTRDGKLISRGRNRRVQQGDPSVHGETDAFRAAGRQRSYRDLVMVTTLAPCWYCSGLVRQFRIGTLVVGESRTFAGGLEWLREHGVEVVDLDSSACRELLAAFIAQHAEVWNEDIGE